MTTTIDRSTTEMVTLTNGTQNPVTITSTGSINTNVVDAIYGSPAADWSIVNRGTISANGGTSIDLKAGGTISNSAFGMISGNSRGGISIGASGIVTNDGTIRSTSGLGIDIAGTGTITNSGDIASTSGIGINIGAVGSVINAGGVIGSTSNTGISLASGGTISNTGDIYSTSRTAIRSDGVAAISNAGIISSNGGTAVFLAEGGTITNSGTILGAFGVAIEASGDVAIINTGSIVNNGTAAISFDGNGEHRVVMASGAVISGAIYASGGTNTLELTATNPDHPDAEGGTNVIWGFGSQYVDFQTITLDSGSSWELAGASPENGQLIILEGTDARLTLVNPSTFFDPIEGFDSTDLLDLLGLRYAANAGATFDGSTLTVISGDVADQLTLTGLAVDTRFAATSDGNGGVLITMEVPLDAPCYAAGTRIRTVRGEVAVEVLRVGDEAVTPWGETLPVTWIGHRRVDCERHPHPERVLPVWVREGAFGNGLPVRDLWLSPDHAVFVEDVLIPIRHLINGVSIAQVWVSEVTYWHVELPRHDVILAEGLPAESYLDTGNRLAFENGGAALMLHPEFGPLTWDDAVAPLHQDGPTVERVRVQLAALAEQASEVGETKAA